jgi:hypothetical protein
MAKFDIAGSMNGIMNDPSYQSVFLKTAGKKEDKDKEKADKAKEKEKADALKAKEKEKADKIKAKEKADKEKAKEKADKEKAKMKAKKSGYSVCVQGLAKISEMLDDAGFDKAASYSLLALDSLVKKAQEVVDSGSANDIDLDEVIVTPEDEIDLPEMTITDEKTDAELLDELLGDTETEDEGFEFNFDSKAVDDEQPDRLNDPDRQVGRLMDSLTKDQNPLPKMEDWMDDLKKDSAVSSLEKMAADLRVILAKKKEEDKKGKDKKDDKKDKKDEKKNPFDKKNPFGNKKDDKKAPAKKDDKKDKKEDKQDAKKCKRAAWDFLG